MVKAFQTRAHSVRKSFKAQSTLKTVFCYDLKTNNWLNVQISRLFWFDSKSTTKKQFSTFLKTPKSKTVGCFDKTTSCFSLSLKNTFNSKSLKMLKLWIQSRVDLHR